MAIKTKIEWTDHTFNPWIGCAKVSPGCANCYAEKSMPSRMFGVKWGHGQSRYLTSESTWNQVKVWDRSAAKAGQRRKLFCASLADWLDDEVPIEWFCRLLGLIAETPNLDWQLLTKRPENWQLRMEEAERFMNENPVKYVESLEMTRKWMTWRAYPKNVWIGMTIENQAMCDRRLPILEKIPASIKFLSMEPLLGPVMLPIGYGSYRCDWIILSGESGPSSRGCNVKWIESIIEQAECPVFVKQLGANPVGVEWDLNDKKGGDIEEFPVHLQLRQFP